MHVVYAVIITVILYALIALASLIDGRPFNVVAIPVLIGIVGALIAREVRQ